MGKDPAFLFYPGDWLGGTLGMTFEEKGAYMELLMLQFNRGHMTTRMVGQTVGQLWDNIKDKFVKDSNDCFYNERLEEEQNKRKSYTESRHNNVSGSNQYSKKNKSNTNKRGHTTSRMEDEDEDEDENKDKNIIRETSFNDFWELYDKKVAKPKALVLWMKMRDIDIEAVMKYIPKYKEAQPDKKYRKNPDVFLRNRSWEDEIIESNGKVQETQSKVAGDFNVRKMIKKLQ